MTTKENLVVNYNNKYVRYSRSMLRDGVFRRWTHAAAIHAASYVDHENRGKWFSISICARGSFPIVIGFRLAGPQAAGAPLP